MNEQIALETRIKSILPRASRSNKKLARFVSDNGLFVAFASATDLGVKTGCSAATVVRFCQSLGYDGYPQLQSAVRASLPTYLAKVEQLEKDHQALDKSQTPERVFQLNIQNLRRTIENLDPERFAAAVAALGRASDIVVIAAGISAAPALYLAHSLKVMGLNANPVINGGIPLALALTTLKPTSVMIGIGVWRYIAETVYAMERAQRMGATRIAITDSIVSPLAQRADFAFQVATDGAAHALSHTSTMALIDALIAALSLARPEETARALRELDAAYRAGKLLFVEPA
jgi:DNA-binding MurR/RpiR family transcriptional regulator